ncbi:hypothetical protein, partial [Serratia sp. ME43]|uniref:hypothetical protein n=1 Tax=Serratia sp. ME43 TaxID=2744256 RepID=UPI001C7137BB
SRAPYLPCGTGFESQKLSHQFLLASSKFFPMSAVHPLSTPFFAQFTGKNALFHRPQYHSGE